MHEKEFKINEYIKLRLIEDETVILTNEKPFRHCKGYKTLNNADRNNIDNESSIQFFVQCSALEAFDLEEYNTNCLDLEFAFALLFELYNAGDNKARNVFKKELMRRFKERNDKVQILLIKQYCGILEVEELIDLKKYITSENVLEELDDFIKYKMKNINKQLG
jgi:hypothetical protein